MCVLLQRLRSRTLASEVETAEVSDACNRLADGASVNPSPSSFSNDLNVPGLCWCCDAESVLCGHTASHGCVTINQLHTSDPIYAPLRSQWPSGRNGGTDSACEFRTRMAAGKVHSDGTLLPR